MRATTETKNALRLSRYLDRLAHIEPAPVRRMEILWIVLAFFLLALYLDATDVNQYVIAEKAKLAECKLAKERSRQYALALTTLLNEKPIVIGETTRVTCRVKEIQS